ncbi:MAG: hypothetical protein M1827_003076 [Pycnora praestabilis]|nr:MAG: hypothetical protein M1827_003076 [Pycnora praestabilis]
MATAVAAEPASVVAKGEDAVSEVEDFEEAERFQMTQLAKQHTTLKEFSNQNQVDRV